MAVRNRIHEMPVEELRAELADIEASYVDGITPEKQARAKVILAKIESYTRKLPKDWAVVKVPTAGSNKVVGEAVNEYATEEEAVRVCNILVDIANRTGEDFYYFVFNVSEYR